jgi:hypothetical protein
MGVLFILHTTFYFTNDSFVRLKTQFQIWNKKSQKPKKISHRFTQICTDFFNQSVKIREIGGKGF